MKLLFILRHGDSVPGSPGNDKERPLSKEGQKEIKHLRKQQLDIFDTIDLVLCSSSIRTRETLACLMKGLPDRITIRYIDALYHASADIILEEVGFVEDKFQAVLVIGHNPGITTFMAQICQQQGLAVDKAMRTGEMAEFSISKKDWQRLKENDLKFIRLLSSKA